MDEQTFPTHDYERWSLMAINDPRPDPDFKDGRVLGLYIRYRCTRCAVVARVYGADPTFVREERYAGPEYDACTPVPPGKRLPLGRSRMVDA